MAIFGTAFSGGLTRRLYQPVNPAGLGRAIAIFVGLVIITQLLQIGIGFGLHAALSEDLTDPEGLTRSIMLGLLPAGLLTAALAWYFASVRRGDPKAVLALRLPDLGPAGWVAIAGGFLVGIHLLFALAISVLGIDPDTKGVVEQAMAGLASDPAYAIVVAGVALAVRSRRGDDIPRPDFRGAVANPARPRRRIGDHFTRVGEHSYLPAGACRRRAVCYGARAFSTPHPVRQPLGDFRLPRGVERHVGAYPARDAADMTLDDSAHCRSTFTKSCAV